MLSQTSEQEVKTRIAAVTAIEGNGSRPSHYGSGWNQGGVMYTLNSVEVHGVAYMVTNNDVSEDNRGINGE